jgi:preprotein translocase subunit YajC
MEALIILAITFGLMWFLFIRPQQRRVREHQFLVASLSVGDEVLTSSGIYGIVSGIEGDNLLVTIAPGVDITIARAAIARRVSENEAAAPPAIDADSDADKDTARPDDDLPPNPIS